MLQAACRGIAIVGNPVTIPILVPGVGGIVSRSLPPLGAVPFPDLAETHVADIRNSLPATVHYGDAARAVVSHRMTETRRWTIGVAQHPLRQGERRDAGPEAALERVGAATQLNTGSRFADGTINRIAAACERAAAANAG